MEEKEMRNKSYYYLAREIIKSRRSAIGTKRILSGRKKK